MDPQMQGAGTPVVLMVVQLVIFAVSIATGWKLFSKMNQPGWISLIPIYNVIVFLKAVGRPAWWLVLLIIPLINLAVAFLVALDAAKAFGKGGGQGVLNFFGIGYLLLAWGGATYKGPAHSGAAAAAHATA